MVYISNSKSVSPVVIHHQSENGILRPHKGFMGPQLFGLYPNGLFTFGLFVIGLSPFGLPMMFGLSPFGLF